ncbi:hypothetical protein [Frankia sp. QA3]|uniref:hypothetical protein n=1 Tax=Frankia sp. QA3 TaxID=710111 RepID=UPI000269BF5D|nr:hypothetical protein [Frankia sp. QA3]EIV92426.1 hypothetical protein FraQA3DRAFT_1988 [Frankia sp. QA3]
MRHHDEEPIAHGLREAARGVVVRPADDLWAGVEARVPRERRRRRARRIVPAAALVVAAAGVVTGVSVLGGGGGMSVIPAQLPSPPGASPSGPPASSVPHAVTLTPTQAEEVIMHCHYLTPERRRSDPLESRVRLVAAVGDGTGVSVLLAATTTVPVPTLGLGTYLGMCTVPLTGSGGLDLAAVRGGGMGLMPEPARRPVDVGVINVDHVAARQVTADRRTLVETAGRVGADVTRLTATAVGGRVLDVPVHDGYFVFRTMRDETGAPPPPSRGFGRSGDLSGSFDEGAQREGSDQRSRDYDHWWQGQRIVLRAYDRDGRLLGEAHGG